MPSAGWKKKDIRRVGHETCSRVPFLADPPRAAVSAQLAAQHCLQSYLDMLHDTLAHGPKMRIDLARGTSEDQGADRVPGNLHIRERPKNMDLLVRQNDTRPRPC